MLRGCSCCLNFYGLSRRSFHFRSIEEFLWSKVVRSWVASRELGKLEKSKEAKRAGDELLTSCITSKLLGPNIQFGAEDVVVDSIFQVLVNSKDSQSNRLNYLLWVQSKARISPFFAVFTLDNCTRLCIVRYSERCRCIRDLYLEYLHNFFRLLFIATQLAFPSLFRFNLFHFHCTARMAKGSPARLGFSLNDSLSLCLLFSHESSRFSCIKPQMNWKYSLLSVIWDSLGGCFWNHELVVELSINIEGNWGWCWWMGELER